MTIRSFCKDKHRGNHCSLLSISHNGHTSMFVACRLAPALMWRKVWLELLRWTGREASELHFISSQPRVRKKRKDSTSTCSKVALLFKLSFPAFPQVCFVSTEEVRPKDEVPAVEETAVAAAEDAARTASRRKKPERRAGHDEGVIKVSQLG